MAETETPRLCELLRIWPAADGEDGLSSHYVEGLMVAARLEIERLSAALSAAEARARDYQTERNRKIVEHKLSAATARIAELTRLLGDILDAENALIETIGRTWDDDPLHDACEAARSVLKEAGNG